MVFHTVILEYIIMLFLSRQRQDQSLLLRESFMLIHTLRTRLHKHMRTFFWKNYDRKYEHISYEDRFLYLKLRDMAKTTHLLSVIET